MKNLWYFLYVIALIKYHKELVSHKKITTRTQAEQEQEIWVSTNLSQWNL